jgi:hypothetical protein
MKSMVVCEYTSVQRKIEVHKALFKAAKTTETAGKQHVGRALDLLNLIRVAAIIVSSVMSLSALLCNSFSSLLIYPVPDLTYQILHALESIHGAQVISRGPTLPSPHSVIFSTAGSGLSYKEHSLSNLRPNSPQRHQGSSKQTP